MDALDQDGLHVVNSPGRCHWEHKKWWTPEWRTFGQRLEMRRAKYRRMLERMRRNPTPRERQIADLIMAGKRNREIARELGVSESVIKNMVSRMYDLYDVKNRIEFFLKMQQSSNQG